MQVTPTALPEDKDLFYALYQSHNIKTGIGHVPFASNLNLLDISLKARSRREDQLFAGSQFLRKNVRRGLSFLEEDVKGVQICRRGLEKFFDLKSEYINMLEGTFDKTIHKLSKEELKLYDVIFEEVEKTLDEGGKVIVYKTEKANGENAQVSYNAKFDAWVIASKNVSTLIRNQADINHYIESKDQNRYAFATLIAQAWLKILDKHVKDVNELKKALGGKTLIGEYCGHPMHQHLVEYNEITIYFFALVDMHGNRTCCSMQVTEAFLKEHNLPMVKITPRKECTSMGELIVLLKELSKEVAENTIEEDAEGAVLYFEAELEEKREILSLCKLKTLEYRLYRKLREKLKSMISKGKQVSEQMSSYKKESEKLCKGYELPRPLRYYYEVAELAFDFVFANLGIARRLGITHRYLDFLKVIRSCKEKHIQPKPDHFKKILESQNNLSDDSDIGDEGDRDEKPKEKSRRTSEEEEEKDNVIKKSQKSRRKTRESVEDEESTSDLDKRQSQSNVKNLQQVIIITPPLYLDGGLIPKIQEKAGVLEIKTDRPKEELPYEGRRVILIHEFPEVIAVEELEKTSIILVAGFNKDNFKLTLKKLESLAGLNEEELITFSKEEIAFIKSTDKQKLLESLWIDYDKFSKQTSKLLSSNYQELQLVKTDKIVNEVELAFQKLIKIQEKIGHETGEKSNKIENKDKKVKKNVLVFVFVGLPGMGKTRYIVSLTKLLEENSCGVTIVSSDKVRRGLMDEFLKKNPKANHQHAFDKSSKHAKTRFFENVEQVLDKINTYPQNTHAIILDKNHPPNIIQDAIEFFHKQRFLTKFNIKTVMVTPHCVSDFVSEDNHYPFSLSFLIKCIQRATARTNHETLVGDARKIATVLVGFFNMYKGFRFSEANFAVMGADLAVSLPFTKEDEEQEQAIRKTLAKPLNDLLHRLRGFDVNEDKLTDFIEAMNTIETEVKDPELDQVSQASLENIKKSLGLFEDS